MSTYTRYLAALAVCLATGLFSAGCGGKPGGGKTKKPLAEQSAKKADDKSATAKDPGDIDIFADEGDTSARGAARDALGTKKTDEPDMDVLETEKIEAPKVEEPKGADIEL